MNAADWFARHRAELPPAVVTAGAVAATAHGGFMVVVAAGVPILVAVIYPLITDGLALSAYTAAKAGLGWVATAYAWIVTILAAGLSGLAQAVYLQSQGHPDITGWLGFGIGYWPAIAGLLAAHLFYLQRERRRPPVADSAPPKPAPAADAPDRVEPAAVLNLPTPVVTEPVIRPIVDLTKTIAPAVRAALSDTERHGLLRVARDAEADPGDRIDAARKLAMGRAVVAKTFGIEPWQARRVMAKNLKPGEAATRLSGYLDTPGHKEATR